MIYKTFANIADVRLARWPILVLALWSGWLCAAQSPSDYTTAYRYDLMGRVTGTISPDPDQGGPLGYPAVRYTYDAAGRQVSKQVGELSVWRNETIAPANWGGYFRVDRVIDTSYDRQGRETISRVSSGGVAQAATQRSYRDGRLECEAWRMNPATFGALPTSACTLGATGSYGNDRITRTLYDAAGQVTTVQKAYGTALQQNYATYTYSPSGQIATVADANGNKTTYQYNGHDRQSHWYFPSKTAIGQSSTGDYESYGYDANGNRTSLRKRDGTVIYYSFDALNRQTLKNLPGSGDDVSYGYDLRSLQTYARYPSGQGVNSSYDGFDRLTASTTTLGGVSRTLNYQYDANGNRTRVTHPDGVYFQYHYDQLDRATAIYQSGSTEITRISYDNKGRRSALTNGITTNYGYDGLNRLSSLQHNLSGSSADVNYTYGYTPASQIANKAISNSQYRYSGLQLQTKLYATNGLNQYTQAGSASISYDANGNLTNDGAGTSYAYDKENRLRSASGAKNLTLSYDPKGRLHQTSGSGATTTQYLYDGDALVAEYASNGAVLRRYVHGPGIDEPLVWYEGSSTSSSARRHLRADHQGSIVVVANSSGSTLHKNSYSPYGKRGSGNGGRFQYTGQILLPELGLYHYKARIYSPELGRFLQTDPVGYEDQMNLYAYVGNDPVNANDPDGEFLNFVVKFVADVAIEAAIQYATTGSVDFGAAATDAALGLLNPAKTLQRAKTLSKLVKQCFAAGTLVLTDHGLIPIEQIKMGDKVLASHPESGERGYKTVTQLFVNTDKEIFELTITDAIQKATTHHVTAEHPYWVKGTGWVTAKHLEPGMELMTEDGAGATVVLVENTHKKETTYNFEVEEFHTYFVGEKRVLVHNVCGGDAAKNATKPLLGKNPTLGKNKNRINTELEGGTATAKSIFRNQTKGQKVTQQPLGPKGGTRRVAEDGTQIRLPNNGSGARVDLPGRGSAGRETIHFTP